MRNAEITNPLFREAVEAIDAGNIDLLVSLIAKHPELINNRLDYPPPGYFQHPYLLWFVADNPIRVGKLPANIVAITNLLIKAVKVKAAKSAQEQLDYTLELVATGKIPHECCVQIAMIDLLIDEGAKPGSCLGALAYGNMAAAQRLIERGGTSTLPAAVGLNRMNDVKRMAPSAKPGELLIALTVAAFYGKTDMIAYLLSIGADPNSSPENGEGFHSHATPLHQAVSCGSLSAVKLLVEAGAKVDARDKIYDGTSIDWAGYLQTQEDIDETARKNFSAIENYLLEKEQAG